MMGFQTRSIIAIILILAALAAGYFFVMPRYSAYQDAKATLASEQLNQQQLLNAQSQVTNFLNDYKAHSTVAAQLNTALPNQEEIYNVLKSLNDLSSASGISLGGLTMADEPQSDTLSATPNVIQPIEISMDVTGTYDGFKNFLNHLESSLRIIDVESVSLQPGGSNNPNLTYQIKLRTYYQQ